MARPERFELPTLWFEARLREILNALSSVACGREHAENCPSVGLHLGYKVVVNRFGNWSGARRDLADFRAV
jgi:hypothetical protein